MKGTQLFVSLVMAGVIDLRYRRPGVTAMSVGAYLGAGGPLDVSRVTPGQVRR